MKKVQLDGGSYVLYTGDLELSSTGNWRTAPLACRALGAKHISQYFVTVTRGHSGVRRYPDSDVVLYIIRGAGTITISGETFPLAEASGIYIKPGEAFALQNPHDEPLNLLAGVCPECDIPEWLDSMPRNFDAGLPKRINTVAGGKRETTGDRWFKVLINEKFGNCRVTQFIGGIPKSKAPEHHHDYEEILTVLTGEGRMWTGDVSTPVGPGHVVYIPRGQNHCMECVSQDGMTLIGMFYPAGSPAVNYKA
ncbi:MAG: cupin domain-containing protein [Gammaproteobacteria bacterium]|nr:cupin domain-containing protein [Gammaproteobacteria bacterium]